MMREAGFERLRSGYMMASLALPLLLLKCIPYRLGRRRPADEYLASIARDVSASGLSGLLLRVALAVEFAVSGVIPFPFGTSVVGVYRKPG